MQLISKLFLTENDFFGSTATATMTYVMTDKIMEKTTRNGLTPFPEVLR